MSTKTTIKRIALVAVSALGFGVLTGVSAKADPSYTASFAMNATSMTIVDAAGDGVAYGIFEVTLTDDEGTSTPLKSGESLVAKVVGPTPTSVDSTTATTDIKLAWPTLAQSDTSTAGALVSTVATSTGTATVTDGANKFVEIQALRGAPTDAEATYLLKVENVSSRAMNNGTYTIQLDLLKGGNSIQAQTLKVTFVSSKLDSGAVLTAATLGTATAGAAFVGSSTKYMRATLKDANGGLVREDNNGAPGITAVLDDVNGAASERTSLTVKDDGSTGSEAVGDVALDGAYDLAAGTIDATASSGTGTLTVRYGRASITASMAIGGAAASSTYAYTSSTGTGVVTGTAGSSYTLPLTTKSFTTSARVTTTDVGATGGTVKTGTAVYYSLSYSGCVTADVSPAAGALTKATTDADGIASVTVTNANPNDSCAATVTWSGAAAGSSGSVANTVTWQKSNPTSVVSDPSASFQAKYLSTNKITWTILDQFSAPVVGQTVTFAATGANIPTAGLASAVTDSSGQVSVTLTDALATATATTDKVGIKTVGTADWTSAPKGYVTITYKTTLSAIASIASYYSMTTGTPTTVTPKTAIGGTDGQAISKFDQIDMTKAITDTACDTNDCVRLNFAPLTSALAAVSGIPVTITSTGGYITNSAGKVATSRVVYASTSLWAVSDKVGVQTITATAGTVTATVTISWVNAKTDARVIKLTESAGSVTATVHDAFGNGVSGVSVDISTSGAAKVSGATYGSYKTASNGSVTIDVVGAGTVTASLDTSTGNYVKALYKAGFGDATSTVVTTGAPAGVASASVDTNGTGGSSDAIDAANDAVEAANAATDAANAAAEAADAATAAAQDAQAAVADLAAQVATLISGIKAQITRLTNLVIKIQKKVRA